MRYYEYHTMAILAENKRALFDYEILGAFEAGIVLKGYEAKAVTSGRVNLSGSYASLVRGELWIVNLDIPPYQPKNIPGLYDPKRSRKLLVTKSELDELIGKTKGLTLIPMKMYSKRGKIKLEIGLAKSRKKKDKREVIKQRETQKEIKRFI